MVMSNFFKFDKEGASARRTPLRTATNAVNLAQAIANRKLAEARIAQGGRSASSSPSRVISARPITTVVDLDGATREERLPMGQSLGTASAESAPSPGGGSGTPGLPPTSNESTHFPVVHTSSDHPTETVEVPLVRKKCLIVHPGTSSAKRSRSGTEPATSSILPQSDDECQTEPVPESTPNLPSDSVLPTPTPSSSKRSKFKELRESKFKKNVSRLSDVHKYFSRLDPSFAKGKSRTVTRDLLKNSLSWRPRMKLFGWRLLRLLIGSKPWRRKWLLVILN